MENLNQEQKHEPESLLKAISIVFPDAKVDAILADTYLKVRVKEITPIQFNNIGSISLIYNQYITVVPYSSSLQIQFANIIKQDKEAENNG